MKITFEEPDEEKAKRLVHCDDVFSLLWNIRQELNNYHDTDRDLQEEIIDNILKEIEESRLLDLYQ